MDMHDSIFCFTLLILFAQLLGLTLVILVAVWLGHYRGGFAWQNNVNLEFNYHPLFMVIGLVFLYGDGMLVYRAFRNERKLWIKLLHAIVLAAALIFSSVGLKAVFDFHNLHIPPFANMYSLHSWIGLTTVILFGLQWLVGFFTFLIPMTSQMTRQMVLPYHIYSGICIFCLSLASCLTGLMEKAGFSITNYSQKPPEGILLNCLGLVMLAFGATVIYIVTWPGYKRQPSPEEQHIRLSE